MDITQADVEEETNKYWYALENDDEGRDWDNEDDENIFDTDPVVRQD